MTSRELKPEKERRRNALATTSSPVPSSTIVPGSGIAPTFAFNDVTPGLIENGNGRNE